MMMCCCRLSPLPHSSDVLGIVSTCLPVATLSLFGLHTLSGMDYRTPTQWRIQTSSRAAGPSLIQRLCGQLWKIIPRTKTAEVLPLSPLLWTEIWEAGRNAQGLCHGWSQNRSQYVDRSDQLILILVHVYDCIQEPFTMWRVVKLECWHNKTLRKVCPRTLFNNTSCSPCCALFPVPKFPSSHMVPKFHILCFWNQGISFHSVSPCFALVWEGRMRPLWTKGSVCKVQMTF